MLRFLKPLSFIPAILMMYLIFSFSSQDGNTSSELSYRISYEIVEVGSMVLGEEFESWEIEHIAQRFHGPIRKLAHMTEYFLLAVAVSFPLYVYGLRGILLVLFAGFFCVAFACGDEYHQSFVNGRMPSKRDIMIDSIGVLFGIILVRIIGWTGRHTIFRPFIRRKTPKVYRETYVEDPVAPYQNEIPYPDNYYSYPHPLDEIPYESDNLSEDMSLKKLVHNLKDQKQEKRDSYTNTSSSKFRRR